MSLISFFNKTLVFKLPANTADSYGGWTESETTIKTVMGSVRPLSGSERADRQSMNVLATHRIYCEYFTETVSEKYVVYIGDTKYNIKLIRNPAGRNRHYEIDVEEIR